MGKTGIQVSLHRTVHEQDVVHITINQLSINYQIYLIVNQI